MTGSVYESPTDCAQGRRVDKETRDKETGLRRHGKTKQGQYMSEQDAIAHGYRAAGNMGFPRFCGHWAARGLESSKRCILIHSSS